MKFAEDDRIEAKCELCDVSVREPLTGRYDERVAQEALDRVAGWMEAHMREFHPEFRARLDRKDDDGSD